MFCLFFPCLLLAAPWFAWQSMFGCGYCNHRVNSSVLARFASRGSRGTFHPSQFIALWHNRNPLLYSKEQWRRPDSGHVVIRTWRNRWRSVALEGSRWLRLPTVSLWNSLQQFSGRRHEPLNYGYRCFTGDQSAAASSAWTSQLTMKHCPPAHAATSAGRQSELDFDIHQPPPSMPPLSFHSQQNPPFFFFWGYRENGFRGFLQRRWEKTGIVF